MSYYIEYVVNVRDKFLILDGDIISSSQIMKKSHFIRLIIFLNYNTTTSRRVLCYLNSSCFFFYFNLLSHLS